MRRILSSLLKLRNAHWCAPWLYDVIAPLAVGCLVAWGANTHLLTRLEYLTMDLRFRSRAPHDPPADSRLLLVGIDEASLERFGRWPWPRERHGDFCKLLAVNDPAVVTFDLLFTEPGSAEDDAYFAAGAQTLPRLITGAVTDKAAPPVPAGLARANPLPSVHGDKTRIPDKAGALIPIPALSAISSFGFVDSDPSKEDGVRRHVPLVLRVGDQVYPSLALQTLLLYWKIPPEQVKVELGRWIEIPSPEGIRRIPITATGEFWLNYRAKQTFSYWSYQGLLEALYRDATGEKPFPSDVPQVKGKIVIVGQVASGLTDLGPSPLEATSPLVLTSLNALNSIFRSDYLHVVPLWPWFWLIWIAVTSASLHRKRSQHLLVSLLLPVGIVVVYVGAAFVLFAVKSVALPLASPVLGFALVHVGKIVTEWIEKIFAERRISAELAKTTQAKKLLEQELEIAREIQFSTLPQIFPPFPDRPEIDLHATMIPAKFVGGDLYEFFFIDQTKLFFAIGDVSGKGVPAALFMTMALAVIRSHVIAGRSPSETLRRSNNVLALRNERCTFVTVFCGLLDTETGHVTYSNGGHNPPVLVDSEGEVTFLETEGTAIGAIEGLEFEERELVLKPNEGLFLYTDGVTEAIDLKEEFFTDERLLETLKASKGSFKAEQITTDVNRTLSAFVGAAPQFDDITVLALFYRGKPGGGNGHSAEALTPPDESAG